jgi:hypothetical protein
MKRKKDVPDIDSVLDEVVADHAPGRFGAGRSVAAISGKGALPPAGRVPGARKKVSPPPDALPDESPAADEEVPDVPDPRPATGAGRAHEARLVKQAARLRAEKAALKEEVDRAKGERETLKAELAKAARRRDAAERELENERARHEAAARDLYDAWRREAGLDFGSERQRVAVERARSGNADAFALAERALAAQAAANAKYGTIRALREEFERIDRLAGELRLAAKDSLYPVPELKKASDALEARRRRLLDDPETAALLAPADPGVAMLSLRAVDALPDGKGSLPQIEMIERIATLLGRTGLVDRTGLDRLRRLLDEKVRRVIRAESSRASGRPGRREETFESLVAGGGSARFALLVDANNLLVTNEGPPGEGGPIPDFAAKRNRLNRALERISPRFLRVVAVYDGIEESEEPCPGGLTVIYTEKSRETADDRIAALASAGDGATCILATDDAGLIARCPKAGAVIGARHLYEYLRVGGSR